MVTSRVTRKLIKTETGSRKWFLFLKLSIIVYVNIKWFYVKVLNGFKIKITQTRFFNARNKTGKIIRSCYIFFALLLLLGFLEGKPFNKRLNRIFTKRKVCCLKLIFCDFERVKVKFKETPRIEGAHRNLSLFTSSYSD